MRRLKEGSTKENFSEDWVVNVPLHPNIIYAPGAEGNKCFTGEEKILMGFRTILLCGSGGPTDILDTCVLAFPCFPRLTPANALFWLSKVTLYINYTTPSSYLRFCFCGKLIQDIMILNFTLTSLMLYSFFKPTSRSFTYFHFTWNRMVALALEIWIQPLEVTICFHIFSFFSPKENKDVACKGCPVHPGPEWRPCETVWPATMGCSHGEDTTRE